MRYELEFVSKLVICRDWGISLAEYDSMSAIERDIAQRALEVINAKRK